MEAVIKEIRLPESVRDRSGVFFANLAKKKGRTVLMVEKKKPHCRKRLHRSDRRHSVSINMEPIFSIQIIKDVWNYISQFASFNRFTNSPVPTIKGELYSLPFNMYTFNKMWGVVTPEEPLKKIEEQRKEGLRKPKNLEEQAISLVGTDIYEKLIKVYTEKQWGRPCTELPAFIIKRLPVRLTFDNNYFNALYQGIPVGGYTKMVARMLDGIEVELNCDYLDHKEELMTDWQIKSYIQDR